MVTLRNRSADSARTGLWRSRWAALGAAVAVSLGAGGMFVAQAAPGASESTIVTVTPERILDTRDPVNVGLAGPFVSAVSQKLQVTGSIATTTGTKTVVPAGATGVLLNVTPVSATANGFISIRPGDAAGAPTTSSLNFTTGNIAPNGVQVALPTAGANAGKIDITFDAYGVAGPTTDILIDVVGYMTNTGLKELVADVALKANTADVNAALATKANAADVYTKADADARFLPVKTVLSYSGSNPDSSITVNYELIRTVGVFTKRSGNTALHLEWSGHHRMVGTGTFCHYQLRIDGKANDGDSALNAQLDQEGNAISYAPAESLTTFAEFPGLAAGAHTVQLFVRGNATECELNPGNFNQQVIVEEYSASAISSFDVLVDSLTAQSEASGQ